MDISKLAEKYLEDHTNPIIKTESFGLKLHLTTLNKEEEERKNRTLENIKHVLNYTRVERRGGRATGEWSFQENTAKVTKMIGFLANFGLHNKNGRFLNAFEALFLLEINKLELSFNKIPVSIQEGFEIIGNFDKYLTYKKLSLQGYRISFKSKQKTDEQKLEGEPPTKVQKIDEVDDIFAKLRQNGPKSFHTDGTCIEADFYVKAPNENVEFGLIVEKNKEYVSRSRDPENDIVYALCSDDFVSFYKFYNANIPIL